MIGFLKEFKEFAVKGNMMDMAVGIIIGASFNKVIDVLVKKVLMPPLSLMSGIVSLQNKKIVLRDCVLDNAGIQIVDEVAVHYGALIEAFVDFIIIGFTIFLVVKAMNRLREKSHDTKDKTVKTPKDIQLLTDLNELMAEQNRLLKAQSANKA